MLRELAALWNSKCLLGYHTVFSKTYSSYIGSAEGFCLGIDVELPSEAHELTAESKEPGKTGSQLLHPKSCLQD